MTTSPSTALGGVKVVSLAVNLPGPLAAAALAAHGATVTKVEPPTGDPIALASPSWYAELIAGQEVLTLDLKAAAGPATLDERLAHADVLLTSMRPSALQRLGLADSVERHGLVLVEIVGFGGDRAEEAGHDLTYQAAHGMLLPPTMPTVPLVDVLGAERAVAATFAGLRRRAAHGGAVRERVVLDDVAYFASAAMRHRLSRPGDILGGAMPTYGIYATADGHVAVAAIEPHFAERLGANVGRTHEELTAAFALETDAHWESLGRELDIPIVAVRDPRNDNA
jgi:alpha-methylacyl-CoA racemase